MARYDDYFEIASDGISATRLPMGSAAGSHWLLIVFESDSQDLMGADTLDLVTLRMTDGSRPSVDRAVSSQQGVAAVQIEVKTAGGTLVIEYLGDSTLTEEVALPAARGS